ncbi:MFS transporter [Burkholderia ubonensis]|uniref:MFS transporter n=1 Tax=Burkholderia ubonensis TaxID=101571 RepID=UPI0007580AAB|nr:MFS transporter [Burkholderia ubonensis]KVQ23621.1 MFS transporter [Burkholderia ubonensis]
MSNAGINGAGVLPATPERAEPHRRMLPLLLIGQGMAAMDTSIVNVAAPALRADLGISGALLQLVVAGYILAYAVFLITGARLGDDYGYRRLFVTGLAIFTVSSLACGVAPGTWLLIVGRIAQGVGAAMLVPQVMSLIQRSFEGPARARAIGCYSMILGLGSTAGQALGGVIITADFAGLSWRPAFLINVPIGIVLLARARSVLPALAGPERRKLDLAGVALLTGAMLLIVVPLTFGHDVGWPAWVWASLAAGVIGVATFLRFERALAQRGGSPLLSLDAVLATGIRPGLAVVSIGFIGYGGWLFACALYLQTGLGFSPMISGFVFAAYAFGFGISNVSWSKLPARLLRFTPAVALIAMAAANLAFGMTARHAGWVAAAMVPLLFCAGASHGLTFGTTVNQMTQRTAPQHAPALSGLVTTSVQLSIVIGVAALGAIYLAVAAPGAHLASARAIADVTFAIGALALVAIACSLRLATVRTPA